LPKKQRLVVFIGIDVMNPTLLTEIKRLNPILKMRAFLVRASKDLFWLSLGKFKRKPKDLIRFLPPFGKFFKPLAFPEPNPNPRPSRMERSYCF
jgi:hypothetical protein